MSKVSVIVTQMSESVVKKLRQIIIVHWNPSRDLSVVAASWLLVVGALYTATVIVGQDVWGGMAYFILYAAYHIGYAMPTDEIVFLFFIGIMFAIIFRLTKNILILWPIFQPMGQLVTLIKDRLMLPTLAALGFVEVLIAMLALVWLAHRYDKKHAEITGDVHA